MPRNRTVAVLALSGLTLAGLGSAQPPAAEDQIRAAVSPAPENLRDSATVLGYDPEGSLVELRAGAGELICLADDPTVERFHVACYHRSLGPFMARGRALGAEGKERDEVVRIRGEEIAAGKLAFPSAPATLYSLTGPAGSFDAATQIVRGGTRVYSVYISYATPETTGLPTQPISDGAPWLMAAGEPWAHIMIVQPSDPPAPAED
jgi:hypothetical protein